MVVCLVGFSTPSADAHWKTKMGTWTSVTSGLIYKLPKGIECKKLTINGKVRKSDAKQEQISEGDHAVLEEKYEECEAGGKAFKNVMGESEIDQIPAKPKQATFSLLSEMVLKEEKGSCEIKIPASSANKGLAQDTATDIKITEEELEMERKEEVSGITFTSTGCEGIKSGSNGEMTGKSIEKGVIDVEEGLAPVWRHRVVGSKGEGELIEQGFPENFLGKGREQTLNGTIGGTPITIASSSVQIKGSIYNNALQGQIKLGLAYNEPTITKPELKGCTVTIGASNIVQLKGHLMWKWNGEKTQLEEKTPSANQTPDLVFTAVEPQQQEPLMEKVNYTKIGVFTSVTFKGTGCGILAGTFSIGGSEVGISNHLLGEWSKKLAVRTTASQGVKIEGEKELTPNTFYQHFLGGEKFQGTEIGLTVAAHPASLVGQTEMEAQQQEIAIFES